MKQRQAAMAGKSETYDLIGADEFTETFELAPPDKPFQIYIPRRHLLLTRTGRCGTITRLALR